MNWIKEILDKHVGEDGKIDMEKAMAEINKKAPKNVVPIEDYNTAVKDKKEAEKKVSEYETEKLTDAEKQQKAIDDANAEKEKYQKMSNRIEVEKIFLGAGMAEDDYKDFIDGIVTADIEGSKSVANAMATTFKAKIAAAEVQAKNDQLKGTPKPGSGSGSEGGEGTELSEAEQRAKEMAKSIGGNTVDLSEF